MARENQLGQPIGDAVNDWHGAKWPERKAMIGRFCQVVALRAEDHADALYDAFEKDQDGATWTYMPLGPFESRQAFRDLMSRFEAARDPHYYAITNQSGAPVGIASLMRIKPDAGSIEVGGIAYAPALQRTPAATEAMFLLMQMVFQDLGYRRYEWKCDALNAPSRRAAKRLGFQFEGIFRQALVYKGRNRDTAWFGMTDQDWPMIKAAYDAWLAPENFDETGVQRHRLDTQMPV
ncbi:GNAT family N-acetyltransferase [Cognatishimia sp.]|uniref:GNAT family N-acetyltransferase n=1 Tax=Cognatishimia sp. TaxID=2211648 RepID=UPI00351792AF